jgi:AcrR family transcriptional regulator
VSRRTVYDHFGSRARLLVALAERADRDLDLDTRAAMVFAAPTGRDAVERFVTLVSEVTPPLLDLASAIERARFDDPDAAAAWEDRMSGRMAACLGLVTRLRDEGQLRPDVGPQEGADILYAAISWQRWNLLVVERGWSTARWVRRTREQLHDALLRR